MSAEQQLRALMEHGEEMGCINMSAFTALVQELDLDDDELNGLYEQIEERGIELTDDCSLPEVDEATYVNSEVAAMTTDSLSVSKRSAPMMIVSRTTALRPMRLRTPITECSTRVPAWMTQPSAMRH